MSDLIVENVQKWLGGLQILKGCSFVANRGSIVALLGASGSGKTTLLRAMAGLGHPEIGRIVIGGQTVLDSDRGIIVPPEKRNIGLVFQSYALWPHRTVRENVGYGLKLRGVNRTDTARRVQETLEHIGLGHLADRYPDQLSGGQQQRVAICRALVYEPKVLLLDEPLSNLDAKLREEARYWIRKLILDLGLCAVLVTHDQSEALAAADQIILLKDGRIVQSGAPHSIYSEPTNFFTADFLGANNILKGVLRDQEGTAMIEGEGWRLPATIRDAEGVANGSNVRAVVRVEEISVFDDPQEEGIELDLVDNVYLGDKWEYRLERGSFKARAHGPRRLEAGRVWAQIPPQNVWLFQDTAAS
ncbi:ABC transporter ATP-binding protein [Radicibacter daui]|uniref:ABC transporter ATP-binding protein n=1 Tax=Radicibacter daui TaxID=3064829 RepID=UPI004046F446